MQKPKNSRSCTNHKSRPWGWGDGLVNEVLATKARGPDFRFLALR